MKILDADAAKQFAGFGQQFLGVFGDKLLFISKEGERFPFQVGILK